MLYFAGKKSKGEIIMTAFKSFEDILLFAIGKEEEAHQFYTSLAAGMRNDVMAHTLREFAEEERRHKEKLEAARSGRLHLQPQSKVTDLQLSDYLVDVDPDPDMDYQKTLVLAMKKEKAAFRLYSDLAAAVPAGEMRSLFAGLAQEEAKHKLRFELEYDRFVLSAND
jgi:rubrerythrin